MESRQAPCRAPAAWTSEAKSRYWRPVPIPLPFRILALLALALTLVHGETAEPFEEVDWGLPAGLPSLEVISLTQAIDGYLWVATSAGLARFDGQHFRAYLLKDLPFLDGDKVKTLQADAEGRLWVLLRSGALWIGDQGKFTRLTEAKGWPAGGAHGLYADAAKRIFVSDKGGRVLRAEAEQLKPWLEACRLSQEAFAGINLDFGGQVWVRHGNQLFWWEGQWKALLAEGKEPFIAVKTGAAREGGMWLADPGGVRRFHLGSWQGQRLAFPETVKALFAVFEDAQGFLWVMPGGSQLWRYDREGDLHLLDGLQARATSATQLVEDSHGHLWMGTEDRGLVEWRPREWRPITLPEKSPAPRPKSGREPRLCLESLAADRSFLWHNESLGFGGQAVPALLPVSPQAVTFQLSAIHRHRSPFRAEVRLDAEAAWTPVPPSLAATLHEIPPGRHALHARLVSPEGQVLGREAEFPFEIPTPFWRTAMFRWAALGLLLLTSGLAVWMQVRRLRAEQDRQRELSQRLIESQEAERQRIAADLHDSLGQKLLVIQNLAQFGLEHVGEPTKLADYLQRVSSTATICVDEVRQITRNLRPYQIDHLGLTLAVKSLASIAETGGATRIELDIEDLDGILPREQEILIYRIFQEGLANALRHAQAKLIILRAHRRGNHLELRVEDDGRGLQHERAQAQGGFGLSSLRERVRMLSGKMDLSSDAGIGCVLSVSVPIP